MRGHDDDNETGTEWVDLREVVVQHHREIFRYARSFTRTDADAEDLAQSAVVRALQRGVIVSDAAGAKWYVMRIVRNLATDAARSRARVAIEPRAEVPEPARNDVTPTDAITERPDLAGPAAAFAALAPADREVLQLRFLEELTYPAVADRMRTTEHGARQRVYRAMQILRAALKNTGEAPS